LVTGSEYFFSSVAFSHDGKLLAGGSREHIVVWDLETGCPIGGLYCYSSGEICAVAFNPDGKSLAYGGSLDKTITIGDLETRKRKVLTGHTDAVMAGPDGKLLASGSCDKTIRIWDLETGKTIQTLTGHTSPVDSVAFSPDGKVFSSGSRDGTIRIWDLETGKTIKTLTGCTGCESFCDGWVNLVDFILLKKPPFQEFTAEELGERLEFQKEKREMLRDDPKKHRRGVIAHRLEIKEELRKELRKDSSLGSLEYKRKIKKSRKRNGEDLK